MAPHRQARHRPLGESATERHRGSNGALDSRQAKTDRCRRPNHGALIAFEVQASRLTDSEWSRRHQDYLTRGITDVWLWNPATEVHRITGESGLSIWQLDHFRERVALLTGQPHPKPVGWWREQDLTICVPHSPPCSTDQLAQRRFRLNRLTIDQDGMKIPLSTSTKMRRELADLELEANTLRQLDSLHPESPSSPPLPRPAGTSDSELKQLPPEAMHCVQCTALAIIRARRKRGTEPRPHTG